MCYLEIICCLKEILFSAQSHKDMTQWITVLKAALRAQDQANSASVTNDDNGYITLVNFPYESPETGAFTQTHRSHVGQSATVRFHLQCGVQHKVFR